VRLGRIGRRDENGDGGGEHGAQDAGTDANVLEHRRLVARDDTGRRGEALRPPAALGDEQQPPAGVGGGGRGGPGRARPSAGAATRGERPTIDAKTSMSWESRTTVREAK